MTEQCLIIICGPTAVGKTAVIKHLLRRLPQLKTGITYTTRAKRPHTKEDKVMYYVSAKQFEQKIRNDQLLEWATYNNDYYGSARQENLAILKKHPLLLNLEIKGSLQVKKLFPKALLVFIAPENLDQISQRLKRRRLSPAVFKQRLANAQWTLKQASKFDYQVVNRENQLDFTVSQIA